METFLSKHVDGWKFELNIDAKIFSKDIILKAAFIHLDKWYFFFRGDKNWNIVLQFTPKDWVNEIPETIIGEFSDTLLETYLRDKLERDNKVIREAIVTKAINWPLDNKNFVTLDTQSWSWVNQNAQKNEQNFDKDIDQILEEIKWSPELEIDENEIEKILEEIENDSTIEKPKISANMEWLKKVKKQFKK